jgi:pilus assembly protein CpaB
MGRRIIAILVAAVVALAGVVAVMLYARSADSRAVAGQQAVDVFVAKQIVPSGTALKDAVAGELIVKTKVPVKAMPVGALNQVTAENSALLALSDIQPGEYVQAARFGTTPAGTRAIQVPPGQVAIAVSLVDAARVGSFVTPGSRVVLFDSYETKAAGGAAGATATRVLLDDVLVIAMGQTALTPMAPGTGEDNAAPTDAAGGALVTVAVTPTDAVRLVHGIQTGRLYAALRGTDAKIDMAKTVSDTSLFTK